MALSAILKARFVVYGFCMILCIVIGGIGGRLLALNVGSKMILVTTVGLDMITAIATVGLMLNAAYQTLKTKPTRDVSGFKIFIHMFLFGIHLLLAGLLVKNRVDIKCNAAPQRLLVTTVDGTMDLVIVYSQDICRLHDALFYLVWVQYAAIATSLTLCILAIDDLRKKIGELWRRVTGKPQVADATLLPRHAGGNTRSKPVSSPEARRSFMSRASWISSRAREPTVPPLSTLPPPPAAYSGGRLFRAENPQTYRGYAVYAPAQPSQPSASSSRIPMTPRAQDMATYAENSVRRAALANVHEPHLTPLPTKPLSERVPRRPADYRRAPVNTRNQI